jgi:hypothetical protein
VEVAVLASPVLQERLDALRRDRDAFLKREPYAAFRIAHEKKRSAARRRWLWLPTAFVAVSAAALLVLTAVPSVDTRIKGDGVGLTVALVGAGAPKSLASGARVHPGDRLQLAYDAGDSTYLALIGIDGSGRATVYYPDSGELMAQRIGAARATFPFSLTLDATPGAEAMVAVFADQALPLRRVVEAVRRDEKLAGVRTVRVVLEKEP